MHKLIGSLAHFSQKHFPNLYKNPIAAGFVRAKRQSWTNGFCKNEIEKYKNLQNAVPNNQLPDFLKVNPPKFDEVDSKTIFVICFGGEENATPIEKACFNRIRKWIASSETEYKLILITYENMYDYIHMPDDIKEIFAKARSTKQTKGVTSGHHPIGVSAVMYLYFWYLLAKYGTFATMSTSLLLPVSKSVSLNPNPIDYIFNQQLWTKTHSWTKSIKPGYPRTFFGNYDQNYWKMPYAYYPLAVWMVEMQIKYLQEFDYFISYSLPVFYLQFAVDNLKMIKSDLDSVYKLSYDENNMWLRERIEQNSEFTKEDLEKNLQNNCFAVGSTRHIDNPILYINNDKNRPSYYSAVVEGLF